MTVAFVPIRTNRGLVSPDWIRNIPSFLVLSAVTILRSYTMYRPLRVFMTAGVVLIAAALVLGTRFLYFMAIGRGAGHLQSLILAAILSIVGFQWCLIGLIADLVSMNGKCRRRRCSGCDG